MNQRWREYRDSYRPHGEPIDPRHYDVAAIADDGPAKEFVLRHHYSRSYPAARFRFGLYRRSDLVGVAVFSVPCNSRALAVFPGEWRRSVELGRFVLLDCVPANGESWFLARCKELLAKRDVIGILSFSDPVQRTTEEGRVLFPGHIGTIYQASNFRWLGRGTARTLRVLPDGRVFSDRAMQKVRAQEQGWIYSAALLQSFGADAVWDDRAHWLNYWCSKLTRRLRHPGNLRYGCVLPRRERRLFLAIHPDRGYPKKTKHEQIPT